MSRVPLASSGASLRSQTGLSLIELMVAMIIGLMLVLMVTSYLISSRHSYQTTMANGDVQDARRFALSVIQQQLWMAGYSDRWSDFGLAFPAYLSEASGTPDFASAQLVASGNDDEVWVRYRAAGLQPLTHCDGTNFPGDDEDSGIDLVAMTRLYLDGRTLRCKVYFSDGSAHDALPLLDDVDAVRWRYLDASHQWQRREVTDWTSVKAIRLEMIVASSETTGGDYAQQFDWGERSRSFHDGHARSRLNMTVALRNLPRDIQ